MEEASNTRPFFQVWLAFNYPSHSRNVLDAGSERVSSV